MPLPSTRLLRYVFDSSAQLRRHARATEGRVLIFYADPLLHGSVGEAVVLELAFSGSDQTTTMGARVHSRATGEVSGVWLELQSACARTRERSPSSSSAPTRSAAPPP
jgi:hypothetical protein